MNPDSLSTALAAVGARLASLAADDPELRSELRTLAQAFLAATDEQDPEQATAGEGAGIADDESPRRYGTESTAGETDRESAVSEAAGPLPELTLGRSAPSEPAFPPRFAAPARVDLSLIETRCRLKAEGCRWAAARQRLLLEGTSFATEIEPRDREINARAKELPDCFLWMCHPSGPSPADLRLYEEVAACFDIVADGVAVVRQIAEEPALYERELELALDLVAEAQSALRVAVAYLDGPTESDQVNVYQWLKETAGENQIFVRRYMRVDDPADPAQWPDLASRIEALDSRLQEARRREKQRRKLLGKIRHKASLIAEEPDEAVDHWQILAAAVDELISDGLPPSNPQLRELLLPVVDHLPEEFEAPRGLELALRELDRYLSTCPSPEKTIAAEGTPEVRQVAELLQERSVVLIGGVRRPGSGERLKAAFGLTELIWLETREHQSIDSFEPLVARPDVALVLLAVRWSSHSFGEVQSFCERYDKPLVRLPGGYNPNQVAAQILAQASERVAAR